MRRGTIGAAGALLALAGCAALEPGPMSSAERQWQRVCERMRGPSTDHAASSAASVSPAAEEVAALRRSAARAAASVVGISTRIEQARAPLAAPGAARPVSRSSGGTGVIVDDAGLILTCAHVVENARDIRVHLPSGATLAALHVAQDPVHDLAIIQISAEGLAGVALTPTNVTDAAAVVALGARCDPADARPGRVTSTAASLEAALRRPGGASYAALIETTAALEPGFSGGPLLDSGGRLVGINVAMRRTDGGAPRGYAIAMDATHCDLVRHLCAAVATDRAMTAIPD